MPRASGERTFCGKFRMRRSRSSAGPSRGRPNARERTSRPRPIVRPSRSWRAKAIPIDRGRAHASHAPPRRAARMKIHPKDFRITGGVGVNLKKWPTHIKRHFKSEKQYKEALGSHVAELRELQH